MVSILREFELRAPASEADRGTARTESLDVMYIEDPESPCSQGVLFVVDLSRVNPAVPKTGNSFWRGNAVSANDVLSAKHFVGLLQLLLRSVLVGTWEADWQS